MDKVDAPRQLGMVSRRKAREAALQALYQGDTIGSCSNEELEFFYQHFFSESHSPSAGACYENYRYSRSLVEGVVANIAAIDRQISEASTHWSIERMARTDRNLLRIAVYEILFVDEVPVNVAINEAIEIAKRFSSPEAPQFINGVLDYIAKLISGDDLKRFA